MPRILVFVVLVLSLTGCDETPMTKEMRAFRQSIQQKVVALDLEQWATNCIAKGTVTEDGASAAIRQLMREGEVSVSGEIGSPERIVLFWYGGGFGHWGIAVGAPTYKCMLGNVQTHWTNGIWFWHE
jgi:hypothetical protein